MRKSRFSEQQIAYILCQVEEGQEICRNAGIGEATYYSWCKKCDGLMPSRRELTGQCDPDRRRASARAAGSQRSVA